MKTSFGLASLAILGAGASAVLSWKQVDASPVGGAADTELAAPLHLFPGGAVALASFTELEPPIRLPLDAAHQFEAHVLVRLSAGEAIELDAASHELVWPVGTELVRVEVDRESGRIADVRRTRIDEHGIRFSAYRPMDTSATELFGAEWLSNDEHALAVVRRAFAEQMTDGSGFLDVEAGANYQRRPRSIARHAQLLDCAACHPAARGEDLHSPSPHALRRATDTSGSFVPRTVLVDDAPLETYRPRDPNAGDAFVTARCGESPIALDGTTEIRCPDGAVPRLHYDLTQALAAADPRARAICASRLWLAQHMTERARAEHRDALRACGGVS